MCIAVRFSSDNDSECCICVPSSRPNICSNMLNIYPPQRLVEAGRRGQRAPCCRLTTLATTPEVRRASTRSRCRASSVRVFTVLLFLIRVREYVAEAQTRALVQETSITHASRQCNTLFLFHTLKNSHLLGSSGASLRS